MAKQKPTSRAAAGPPRRKNRRPARSPKAAAKSTARKSVKSKARAAPPSQRRPKQRIAISHYRDEDFKPAACAPTRNTAISASPPQPTVWPRRM